MRTASNIGRRLARIRASRGLTQAELARRIGKSRQTICHWENDPFFEMRSRDIDKLARALGCLRRDVLAPRDKPLPSTRANGAASNSIPQNWQMLLAILRRNAV